MSFLRGSRQLHRWIAYVIGALVLVWSVTGVVMMFPPPMTIRASAAEVINPADATRTPAEALHALALGEPAVRSLTLRRLAGRLVYDFTLPGGAHAFVDATTAEPVVFNDSLARALLNTVLIDGVTSRNMVPLAAHDDQYRFGALPAFRFELDDAAGTLVHIASDGMVSSSNRRGRFRGVMAALHEFQLPGGLIPQKPRKLLLLGASAFTIVLIVTGYVLVLPARWFGRRAKAG
jgi:uncharacterized iron-regulated membrane protein